MELTSIVGLILGVAVLIGGLGSLDVASIFVNAHGILIVVGGTAASILLHCHWSNCRNAIRGFFSVFKRSPYRNPENLIPVFVELSENAKKRGPILALQNVPQHLANGFMGKAVDVAVRNIQNPDVAKTLIDRMIIHSRHQNNEAVNVFRVGSVLAPMFGLIGTLIGIIQVLRNITSPESASAAMAVAITSAFYGIALANMIFVPIAGKLRLYMQDEALAKSIISEGLSQILKQEMPFAIEQRLYSLLDRTAAFRADEAPRTRALVATAGNATTKKNGQSS